MEVLVNGLLVEEIALEQGDVEDDTIEEDDTWENSWEVVGVKFS